MAIVIENRQFKMAPELALDVMQCQAGSLWKAVIEGIMNSVDAGASRIDITLNSRTATIDDDGRGIRSREEVENFFEVLGQPHTKNESKQYARFRMGRGQLFSFGRNIWRSCGFRMSVDIQRDGLNYRLQTGLSHHDGCKVIIELYKSLSMDVQIETSQQIAENAAFVTVPVFVNGKQINKDPNLVKWDVENELADILLTRSSWLKVYNKGILAKQLPFARYGCGGIVVTKQALKVNLARNDIMDSCPVWEKLVKQITKLATSRNLGRPRRRAGTRTNRTYITVEVRRRLARQIISGAFEKQDIPRLYSTKVFKGIDSKFYSILDIQKKFAGRVLNGGKLHSFSSYCDKTHFCCLAFVFKAGYLPYAVSVEDICNGVNKLLSRKLHRPAGGGGLLLTRVDADKMPTVLPENEWPAVARLCIECSRHRLQGLRGFVIRCLGRNIPVPLLSFSNIQQTVKSPHIICLSRGLLNEMWMSNRPIWLAIGLRILDGLCQNNADKAKVFANIDAVLNVLLSFSSHCYYVMPNILKAISDQLSNKRGSLAMLEMERNNLELLQSFGDGIKERLAQIEAPTKGE